MSVTSNPSGSTGCIKKPHDCIQDEPQNCYDPDGAEIDLEEHRKVTIKVKTRNKQMNQGPSATAGIHSATKNSDNVKRSLPQTKRCRPETLTPHTTNHGNTRREREREGGTWKQRETKDNQPHTPRPVHKHRSSPHQQMKFRLDHVSNRFQKSRLSSRLNVRVQTRLDTRASMISDENICMMVRRRLTPLSRTDHQTAQEGNRWHGSAFVFDVKKRWMLNTRDGDNLYVSTVLQQHGERYTLQIQC